MESLEYETTWIWATYILAMIEKLKSIIGSLVTDANGEHELTCYSFILTTIGVHCLMWYNIHHGIAITLTEYVTAMSGNAAGHGIAYFTRTDFPKK